jgi:predicted O-methyltransferase YrrM
MPQVRTLRDRLSCRPRVFDLLHRLHLVEPVTQTNLEELACLLRYCAGRRSALEIGTFMGVSAAVIARGLAPGGKLYCVDPYEGGEAIRRIALRHLSRAGMLDRIELVRARIDAADLQLPASFDFAFVDGDHSYEGLRADWELVRTRLTPGGVACFHDTTLPPEIPCGAADFFSQCIRDATGFEHLETCHSMNVMRRSA